ncbi:hypothetical protein B0H14DRAFT_2619421 [Mycena olivaceomarginata]|nr:hypothetical protein B0H14DRAFT_2619421 [Mycena olivaceomarginata]
MLHLQHSGTYCIGASQCLVWFLAMWSLHPTPADCSRATLHIAWPPRFPRHAAVRTGGQTAAYECALLMQDGIPSMLGCLRYHSNKPDVHSGFEGFVGEPGPRFWTETRIHELDIRRTPGRSSDLKDSDWAQTQDREVDDVANGAVGAKCKYKPARVEDLRSYLRVEISTFEQHHCDAHEGWTSQLRRWKLEPRRASSTPTQHRHKPTLCDPVEGAMRGTVNAVQIRKADCTHASRAALKLYSHAQSEGCKARTPTALYFGRC